MHCLCQELENQEPSSSILAESDLFEIGENIAAFWIYDLLVDESFTGIVEKIISPKTLIK